MNTTHTTARPPQSKGAARAPDSASTLRSTTGSRKPHLCVCALSLHIQRAEGNVGTNEPSFSLPPSTKQMAQRDPVLAALPAEVRDRVERTLASYGTEAGPAESSNLFPEIPLPGEVVTAPPLPKQPPRKAVGKHYCSGSQPEGWVERSVKLAREYRPKTLLVPPKRGSAAAPRPEWSSSPSGRWKQPLIQR